MKDEGEREGRDRSTGRAVLDSGAIAALFFREEVSDRVEEVVEGYSEYYTASQAYSEVANVAWKKIRMGEDEGLSRQALEGAIDFIDKVCIVEDNRKLLERAFRLAVKYGITVYDALFVALAIRLNARLVTTDRMLYERLKGTDLEGLGFLQVVE